MEGIEQVIKQLETLTNNVKSEIEQAKAVAIADANKNTEGVVKGLEEKLQNLDNQLTVLTEKQAEAAKVNLDGVDADKFSFARAAAIALEPSLRQDKEFGFENEVREQMAKRKDATASDGSQGGFLVPTSIAQSITEPAIAQMPLRDLGMTVINGLMGNLDIPSLDETPQAGHTSENGRPDKTNYSFTSVQLRPRRASHYTKVSKRVLMNTPLALEEFIRRQLVTGLALAMENGAINGTGGDNEPTGILNMTGFTSLTDSITGQFTVKQADQMQDDLEEANHSAQLMAGGQFGYLTRPRILQGMRMARTTFYTGQTTGKGFQINNAPITTKSVEDYTGAKFRTTTLVPTSGSGASATSQVVYGNWMHLIMGLWAGMEVRTSDVASDATNSAFLDNLVMILAQQEYDVNSDLKSAFVKAGSVAYSRSAWTEY